MATEGRSETTAVAMKRCIAVLAIALTGLQLPVGHAQESTNTNDLFAAYCLGVLRSSGVLLNQAHDAGCTSRKDEACNWVVEAIGQRAVRLDTVLHYLQARGLSIAPDSPRPMILLADSGRQDSQLCLDWQLAEPGHRGETSSRPAFCQRQDICSDLGRLVP